MGMAKKNAIANCKLCGSYEKLCESHIIPEFFFKRIYEKDSPHRLLVMSTKPEENPIWFQQKAHREYLLCLKCESQFSVYEKYAEKALYSGGKLGITEEIYKELNVYKGIDYKKMKLFFMSILWRMSIAQNKFFKEVNLGPFEEKLKYMLLNEEPGEPKEFGCLLLFMFVKENEPIPDAILSPTYQKIQKFHTINFLINSMTWIFVYANHNKPMNLEQYFLNKDKIFIIKENVFRRDVNGRQVYRSLVNDLFRLKLPEHAKI